MPGRPGGRPVGPAVADTLKQSRDGRVATTLDRSDKWAAQTPQMFRLGLLQQALQQATSATDEASAVEALGHAPLLVRASAENFKVTWPEDFALAERAGRALPGGPEQQVDRRTALPCGAQRQVEGPEARVHRQGSR